MLTMLASLMAGWLFGCACALALYVRIEWRRRRAVERAEARR